MSGKQAKKMRREARNVHSQDWTKDVPHPADEQGVEVRVERLPPRNAPPVQKLEAIVDEATYRKKDSQVPDTKRQLYSEPVFLTLKEVAARLSVSPRTVQRMEKAPGFPVASRFARVVRYHWPSIEKWLLYQR